MLRSSPGHRSGWPLRGVLAAAVVALGAAALPGTAAAVTPTPASPGAVLTSGTLSPLLEADLATLDGTSPYQALIRIDRQAPADWPARLAAADVAVLHRYDTFGGALVAGPLASIGRLPALGWVAHVEPNYPVELFNETIGWATRVEEVRRPVNGGPYTTPGGAPLDGSGVGVAIIDSGVDGTHPDLDLASNWVTQGMVVAGDLGPDTNSDAHSGHGTHVAGILAGSGAASQGEFRGVAPEAGIHAFSAGAVISAAWVLDALELLYDEHDTLTPTVRVVNISAGNRGGTAYNPSGLVETGINRLVNDKDVTVVVAAGNDGGDGSADTTSGWCKNPTPGVICVSNYDDNGTGDRTGDLDASSSRGHRGTTATWPDLAAPGTFVTSSCATTSGVLCSSVGFVTPNPGWAPWYGNATGTSMSSPHVAGIVTLLTQARPSLTPAQIEDILEDTAQKVPLPAGETYAGGFHHGFGAGLVDAVGALTDSRVGAVATNGVGPAVLTSGDSGDHDLGAVDIDSLSVSTTATSVVYRLAVRDLADAPPARVSYRILQNVGGEERWVNFSVLAGAAEPAAAESPDDPTTAEPSGAVVSGDTIVVTVPRSELGPAGAIGHNVQAGAYVGAIQDVAPSPSGQSGSAADLLLFPRFAAPYKT